MALQFLYDGYFAGKVGIGTDSPTFQLSIENHATTTSTATMELDGKRTDGTDGSVGEMIFSNNGDTFATVAGFRDGADNKGSLQFQTQDSTFATRMTISSEGSVGIGTTTPQAALTVAHDLSNGGDATGFRLNAASGTTSNTLFGGPVSSGDYAFFQSYKEGTSAGVRDLNLNPIGGDVGINTTSPDFKLDVDGTFGVSDLPFNTDSVSVLVADEITGVEEVTNGSFTTDANWNKNPNWTISGGTANADGTSNQDMNQIPVNGYPVVGEVFRVSFEITARTQGQVRIEYGDAVTDFVSAINKYEYILTAVSTDRIRIQCQNSFIGSVDNLSIKQITSASNQIQKREISSDVFTGGPYLPLAGGTMTGNTIHNDNVKSIYGTASDGLEIYHDGTNSYITDSGTGRLRIKASTQIDFLNGAANETMANFIENGAIKLYFDDALKFETTSVGIAVTGDIQIDSALLSNQENTDVDTGTETVANVAIATYTAAFFDFVIKKGLNVRSGTVYACHDGDTTPLVAFTETSTQDLGDTSDVTLSVDISGTNMRLQATTTSDDWSIKSLIRAI